MNVEGTRRERSPVAPQRACGACGLDDCAHRVAAFRMNSGQFAMAVHARPRLAASAYGSRASRYPAAPFRTRKRAFSSGPKPGRKSPLDHPDSGATSVAPHAPASRW